MQNGKAPSLAPNRCVMSLYRSLETVLICFGLWYSRNTLPMKTRAGVRTKYRLDSWPRSNSNAEGWSLSASVWSRTSAQSSAAPKIDATASTSLPSVGRDLPRRCRCRNVRLEQCRRRRGSLTCVTASLRRTTTTTTTKRVLCKARTSVPSRIPPRPCSSLAKKLSRPSPSA